MQWRDGVELSWARGSTLEACIQVALFFEDPSVIQADRRQTYAWFDQVEEARAQGRTPPPPHAALTPGQARAIDALSEDPEILDRIERLAGSLTNLVVTNRHHGGFAYVEVMGRSRGERFTAVVHGHEVLGSGPEAKQAPFTERPEPPRPAPWSTSAEEVLDLILADDPAAMRARLSSVTEAPDIDAVCVHALVHGPFPIARRLVAIDAHPTGLVPTPHQVLHVDPERLRWLVDHGVFTLPKDVLFDARTIEEMERWIALGADVNARRRQPGSPGKRGEIIDLVTANLDRPERLAVLVAHGADISALEPRLHRLSPEVRGIVLTHHPHLATHAAPTRVRRRRSLAQDWIDRGWLVLEEEADPAAVRAAVDALPTDDAGALIDAILDLPGVEDLYVADDDIEVFLKRWRRR